MKKFTISLYVTIFILVVIKSIINYSILTSNSNFSERKNEYDIFIDLEENKLSLYKSNVLIKTYKIASGKHSTPSPVGIWKIVKKSRWGGGFGGRFMKLNVPWGIYGIHGTKDSTSIGIDASQGCIRMYNDDVAELSKIVPIGTVVKISNGAFDPFEKTQRVIKPGNRGSDVLAIQKKLKELGFYKDKLDGIYGDNLKRALFKFQKSKGYRPHNNITKWDLQLMEFEQFK